MQLSIEGVWTVQGMLLGDHVREKSDVVKWIDCHLLDYVMLMSSN